MLYKLIPLLEQNINSLSDFTEVDVTISGNSNISFLFELKFTLNNLEKLLITLVLSYWVIFLTHVE